MKVTYLMLAMLLLSTTAFACGCGGGDAPKAKEVPPVEEVE